jgi:hypothetical protein
MIGKYHINNIIYSSKKCYSHEFFDLLKWDEGERCWKDWSIAIKNIVHNASQQSLDVLLQKVDQWPEAYKFPNASKFGTVDMKDIYATIPSKCLREEGSIYYHHREHMHDMTMDCINNVAKNMARTIRKDIGGKSKYVVVIIGCIGSAVNCINLCVAILVALCCKDCKVEFHIYETKVKKCNTGND